MQETKFSANLGFLWTELDLPAAIYAAKKAGFDAVECHWPYEESVDDIKLALVETNLKMLSLNTVRGDVLAGEMGLSALPHQVAQGRSAIDQALSFADEIGAENVHVLAGICEGKKAHKTFIDNLFYACQNAASQNKTILIEPLNPYDAPGYFLSSTDQAIAIIEEVDQPNLKLMFDCYHVGRIAGDVCGLLAKQLPYIGHIQIASVPDRRAPDHGDVDYQAVFKLLAQLGYSSPLGAEYHPDDDSSKSLGWMATLR